jgi:hypothetical protein
MNSKDKTGIPSYILAYGKESKMEIILELIDLNFVVNTEDAEDSSPMQKRVNHLLKLEEE